MNWTKIVIAGVVGGIVMNLADYVLHGMILGNTYRKYPDVFTQEAANPLYFFLIAICVGLAAAIFFAKSRKCWPPGVKGGIIFGCLLGLVLFFHPFYSSLVIDGWPYFLSWCQGGSAFIAAVVLGAVLGALYKEA